MGDLFGCRGRSTNCVRDGKIKGKILDVPGVILQLQLKSLLAEEDSGWSDGSFGTY